MVVAVDDPGQEPEVRAVDGGRLPSRKAVVDGGDEAVLDEDVERSGEAAPLVEDVRVAEDEGGRAQGPSPRRVGCAGAATSSRPA